MQHPLNSLYYKHLSYLFISDVYFYQHRPDIILVFGLIISGTAFAVCYGMKSAKAQSKQLSGPGRFYLRFRRRETEGPAIIKEIVMFTRQHYKAIAEIIKKYSESPHQTIVNMRDGIVCELADYFAADNKRFDRVKFLDACGVD